MRLVRRSLVRRVVDAEDGLDGVARRGRQPVVGHEGDESGAEDDKQRGGDEERQEEGDERVKEAEGAEGDGDPSRNHRGHFFSICFLVFSFFRSFYNPDFRHKQRVMIFLANVPGI